MKQYTDFAKFIIEHDFNHVQNFSIDKVLLSKAVIQYGVGPQLDQLIEEMAELMVAINHGRRHNNLYEENICEEVADVLICLNQLMIIIAHDIGDYGSYDYIEKLVLEKQSRLKARLEA